MCGEASASRDGLCFRKQTKGPASNSLISVNFV